MAFARHSRRAFSHVRFGIAVLTVAFSLCGRAGAGETGWLARAASLRIMALGDSITAGVGTKGIDIGSGGYRGELERLLDAHGYTYAMIGGRSDFSARVRMRGHEGHPGYVIRSFPAAPAPQLYGAVTKQAIAAYDPDVILLMAGTNDLLRLTRHAPGYTLPNIVSSMDILLAEIFYEKPSVAVIVAGVVDSPNIPACAVERFDGVENASCGASADRNVKTLVAAFAARGFHVVFAPGMDVAVPRDKLHFPDGIHPCGPGGYEAVARVWMRAIDSETGEDAPQGTVAGR